MPSKTPPKEEGFTTVLSSPAWVKSAEQKIADGMEDLIINLLSNGFEEGDEIDITTFNQQNEPITENFTIIPFK